MRASHVPEALKKVSKKRKVIFGGQVITQYFTKITFNLGRTLVRGILGALFGRRRTGGQFSLVDSFSRVVTSVMSQAIAPFHGVENM